MILVVDEINSVDVGELADGLFAGILAPNPLPLSMELLMGLAFAFAMNF